MSEVVDVLDMWDFVEASYEQLSANEKTEVEREVGTLGQNPKFYGFDGNNETDHLGAADVLINKLDRFQRFHGRNLNSHMPSLAMYGRMLRAFLPIRKTLMGNLLSSQQLISILKEKVHPDNR